MNNFKMINDYPEEKEPEVCLQGFSSPLVAEQFEQVQQFLKAVIEPGSFHFEEIPLLSSVLKIPAFASEDKISQIAPLTLPIVESRQLILSEKLGRQIAAGLLLKFSNKLRSIAKRLLWG